MPSIPLFSFFLKNNRCEDVNKQFVCQFTEVTLLKNGKFGRVFTAVDKTNTSLIVIKTLQKRDQFDQAIPEVENLQRESSLLRGLNHPFIVGFNFCFETSSTIALGMQYCSMGDILSHLATKGRFNEDAGRFYISELVVAVEYIHEQGILHRDIKPENLLIDNEGHLQLCDFGISKKGEVTAANGATTLCGTITYMAPELFRNSGYGYCADWWLVGMTAFEMLIGTPAHQIVSNQQISDEHHSQIGTFDFLDYEAMKFLSAILESDQRIRLGREGATEVKSHQYFEGVDWFDVLEQNYGIPSQLHVARKN